MRESRSPRPPRRRRDVDFQPADVRSVRAAVRAVPPVGRNRRSVPATKHWPQQPAARQPGVQRPLLNLVGGRRSTRLPAGPRRPARSRLRREFAATQRVSRVTGRPSSTERVRHRPMHVSRHAARSGPTAGGGGGRSEPPGRPESLSAPAATRRLDRREPDGVRCGHGSRRRWQSGRRPARIGAAPAMHRGAEAAGRAVFRAIPCTDRNALDSLSLLPPCLLMVSDGTFLQRGTRGKSPQSLDQAVATNVAFPMLQSRSRKKPASGQRRA